MVADFRKLWETRKTSGFPRPFTWSVRTPTRRAVARQWLTGYVWYSSVSVWRQVLGIPLRPWRWAKMMRGIARTRNAYDYDPRDYDDVP